MSKKLRQGPHKQGLVGIKSGPASSNFRLHLIMHRPIRIRSISD